MNCPVTSKCGSQIFFVVFAIVVATEHHFVHGDEPRWMGKTSCAAATCHGGIIGNGPGWNSSLNSWESTDHYHVNAGKLLENHQSRRMVARLLGQFENIDNLSSHEIRKVLEQRCVSCHAPGKSTHLQTDNELSKVEVDWQDKIIEGVSCEACHGPASNWIDRHTRKDYSSTSLEAISLGMVATKSWLERTDTCTKCHVGSRTTDGVIRDMNHDLIAAGHPALRFDMSRYQYYLAPHWSVARKGPESVLRELPSFQQHNSARFRTLAAVAKLSLERIADSKEHVEVPQPEFADFDCYQCHQSIQFNIRFKPRHLAWNPFYTSHLPATNQASLPFTEIRLRSTENTPLVKVFEAASEMSTTATQQNAATAIQIVQSMQQLRFPQGTGEADWLEAAGWYWSNRIAMLNIAAEQQTPFGDTQASLGKLSQLLGQFESALASSPIANVVRLDAKPVAKPIDFLQLRKLYQPYTQQLESVKQAMHKASSSGANQ